MIQFLMIINKVVIDKFLMILSQIFDDYLHTSHTHLNSDDYLRSNHNHPKLDDYSTSSYNHPILDDYIHRNNHPILDDYSHSS